MRGENVLRETTLHSTTRLIPACAGKTTQSRLGGEEHRAHPRMRGENEQKKHSISAPVGSSPHARGKPGISIASVPGVGLIPACAGKTVRMGSLARDAGAHPRMRGENIHSQRRWQPRFGSSPHARGKLTDFTKGFFGPGLIPACAGKTEPKDVLKDLLTGSSPHARGKLPSGASFNLPAGLIPACAGKTRGYL